jgi:hypothetical protein
MRFPYILAFAFAVAATSADAQYMRLHGVSIATGGFGQFDKTIESNPTPVSVNYRESLPFSQFITQTTTAQNQQQFTTMSAGFLASMQFHPVAWAGVEFNYGYTRYSERYTLNYAVNNGVTSRSNVPTSQHEATGAYLFHPKHIPFQPFMGIGGGAIDFDPAFPAVSGGTYQWRGAGLLEAGFDLPTMNKHLAFRVEGRSLFYRAPNFGTPVISTRSWRAQTEPVLSAVYRF